MKAMKVRRRFETRGHRVELHVLPPNDPALLEMRTIYPSTVRSASANTFVLKSGENSTKLGNKITKGLWKGMAIYSLTLEERKTCPATCQQLSICFGNNMPFAQRWNVDTELYARLRIDWNTFPTSIGCTRSACTCWEISRRSTMSGSGWPRSRRIPG